MDQRGVDLENRLLLSIKHMGAENRGGPERFPKQFKSRMHSDSFVSVKTRNIGAVEGKRRKTKSPFFHCLNSRGHSFRCAGLIGWNVRAARFEIRLSIIEYRVFIFLRMAIKPPHAGARQNVRSAGRKRPNVMFEDGFFGLLYAFLLFFRHRSVKLIK